MEDERWIRRGVDPLRVDDWPEDRVFWLDRVMNLREQAASANQHEQQSDAAYQQWLAERGRK